MVRGITRYHLSPRRAASLSWLHCWRSDQLRLTWCQPYPPPAANCERKTYKTLGGPFSGGRPDLSAYGQTVLNLDVGLSVPTPLIIIKHYFSDAYVTPTLALDVYLSSIDVSCSSPQTL
jgi:hypothetical protein